jgi:hypothetical protein
MKSYSNSNSLMSSDGRPRPKMKIIRRKLNATPKYLRFGRFMMSIEGTDRY